MVVFISIFIIFTSLNFFGWRWGRKSSSRSGYRVLKFDSYSERGVHGNIDSSNVNRVLKSNEYIFFEDESKTSQYLISNFGEDEYRCFGACYCMEDEEIYRRSDLTVSRGMIYLLTAITGFVAFEKAKAFFDRECEARYSDECSQGTIESNVEDCDLVDDSFEMDEIEDNILENRKFFCQGFCMGNEECTKIQKNGLVSVLPGDGTSEASSIFERLNMKEMCEEVDGCYSSEESIHCESTSPKHAGVIRRRKSEVDDHYDGKKFYYPKHWEDDMEYISPQTITAKNIAKYMWEEFTQGKDHKSNKVPSYEELPVTSPRFVPNSELKNDVAVTWIGHCSFLVQLKDGMTFLTDPVFSEKASPTSWYGPWRYREVPITVDRIPIPIDAVLISHNHYDHLDYQSVVDLAGHSDPLFFVPLENKKWFVKNSVTEETRIVEMDWYEYYEINAADGTRVRINFVPSQHSSSRTMFDQNKELWGGWIVEVENKRKGIPKRTFYFVGDTGYNPILFKEIGDEFGPIDFGFVPIGAYEPRYLMEREHATPGEGYNIAKESRVKKPFSMHHSTFKMSHEGVMEPVEKLEEEEEKDRGHHIFEKLMIGETYFFDYDDDDQDGWGSKDYSNREDDDWGAEY